MKNQEIEVYNNSEGTGIDFIIDENKVIEDIDYLIYYGNTKLSDKYFISNVGIRVNSSFITSGKCKCWVRGKIRKGDYLTTCRILGVAIMNKSPLLSFGKCLTNKPYESIDLVDFEFIK